MGLFKSLEQTSEAAAHVFLTCFTRVCEVLNCVTVVMTVEAISHQANLGVHPGMGEWLIIICRYLLWAKGIGWYDLGVKKKQPQKPERVCTMKANELWPLKHCVNFWKRTPSIIFSTLLQYAQQSLFIWQENQTYCATTPPDRHIINPPRKWSTSQKTSSVRACMSVEAVAQKDGALVMTEEQYFCGCGTRSSTKYLYESDFHPSAALTWYGSLQSNKTLHSWHKQIGKK